jgi:hypothetical protein
MVNEQESLLARRVRGAADRGTSARSRALSARAFELAARLEAYEADLEALALGGFDPARYRLLLHQLRDLGASALTLPQVAADLMQITIQHFELIRLICRPRVASAAVRDQAQAHLLRQQCDAVRAVRNKCLRLIRASHARPFRPVFTRR